MYADSSALDTYNGASFAGLGGGGEATGGGGFFPSSLSSQGHSSQHERERKKPSSLVPCSIKQLLEATPANHAWNWNGHVFSQVSLVCVVRSQTSRSVGESFVLEDGSCVCPGQAAFIQATLFTDRDTNEAEMKNNMDFSPNGSTGAPQYVFCIGKLVASGRASPFSSGESDRQLTLVHMEPLRDFNRITAHALDVVRAFLHNTGQAKKPEPLLSVPDSRPSAAGPPGASSFSSPSSRFSSAHVSSAFPYAPSVTSTQANEHGKQFQLINAIANHPETHSEIGIRLASILAAVSWPEAETRFVLEQLLDNGQLYCTLDDCYKPTNL